MTDRRFLFAGLALVMTSCLQEADDRTQTATAAPSPLSAATGSYLVGTGIYDITGPAAEIGMMGYADSSQKTAGIHTRLRARTFIVGDGQKRVVFVSADLGMLFESVKLKVADRIAADPELKSFYDERNILLSATHTHGGPGGFSGYFLYDATISGFIQDHHAAIVDGIVQSIRRAHRNLRSGQILVNEGRLDGLGGNRAEVAYDNNPAAERAQYDSNTDKTFTVLKFVTDSGEEVGMFSWFAVHADSIGPANHLITADNKGWASYLFEKDKGTASTCYGSCASAWPPLTTSAAPKAGTDVKASALGTTKRKDGTSEVTYNGHPLYYYVGDGSPGSTTGQGLDQFGAEWYVLAPSGNKIDHDS